MAGLALALALTLTLTLALTLALALTKVGSVLHVACDKWSNGFVYVKMFSAQARVRVRA